MLTKEELLNIINSNEIPNSVYRRKYVEEIKTWLQRKEIIIIKGIRRCGKTHIMNQLKETLPKENSFYVDFDDFRFDNYLDIDLLEKIISLRDKTKPSYFFLDEIQRIKGFEKWLRTYYDHQKNIKFIIGGSNISLFTPKLATVLTGRNITFEVYPLDYVEFQDFSNESFDVFLRFGGFPEIVLTNDETQKRRLLRQYVEDIVTKDIIQKYELTNITQVKALVSFFLSNPGVKISANKLGKQLGISKTSAQKYIDYVKDTFLIFEVPYFSYSAKTKYIGSQASKYYCIDNGLHTITTTRKNKGILFENIVAIKLNQTNDEVFYWQDLVEIDFVADKKAIQVTATDDIPEREINAFEEFNKKHKHIKKKIIITPTINKKINEIEIKSITSFLK
jgi:hypothetical protein